MNTATANGVAGESQLRVLVADDHPVFVSGIRVVLDTMMARVKVVGEVTTGVAAIEAARRLRPDLVLMDVNMPQVNGIEATKRILHEHPGMAVLVLTMFDDNDTLLAAVRAGARGYLLKGAPAAEVTLAVEAVSRGEAIFGSHVANRIMAHITDPLAKRLPFPDLTDRERAVLELVADGRDNTSIARALGLSSKTVRNYMSRIFVKLQVADRAAAAVRARRAGIGCP